MSKTFIPSSRICRSGMLDGVITGPIADLEKALDAKDFSTFSVGYSKLTEACNSCNQATGTGFVLIQRPVGLASRSRIFKPSK